MFYALKARKPEWILTATICPQFGIRPQVDISKTAIKKNGGIEMVKNMAEKQSAETSKPIAFFDFEGNMIFQSTNWTV